MRKIVFAVVVAVAVAFPAAAGAASFSGIVVAKQVRRHALVVASRTGAVRVVHTHRLATRLGGRVAVRARPLQDGTFSATHVSVRGRAHRARIHGAVVRRLRGRVLVAAGHSVLSIRTHRLFSLQDDNPGAQPGDEVDETVSIDNGDLDEDQVEEVGHTQKLELEGSILSVTAPTSSKDGEIVLQVGASTIHVVVPGGMQLPSLATGQNVELKVTLSGTTFTLVKAQDEDDDQGDDDQGDDDGGGGGD
jgi:hypothetical protein